MKALLRRYAGKALGFLSNLGYTAYVIGGLSAVVVFLFWMTLGLREDLGAEAEKCNTRISQIAEAHQIALRDKEREIRAEEAADRQALQEALDQEHARREEERRKREAADAQVEELLDELNSQEEIEWKEQPIPERIFDLG